MNKRDLEQSKRLKKLRLENGYTQEQIAEILEITTSGYKKIENGECRLTKEKLIMLVEKLNISEGYLLFGNRSLMDTIWVEVMSLPDEEKMRILLRLNEYFIDIKKSSMFEKRYLDEADAKISEIIKLMSDGNL